VFPEGSKAMGALAARPEDAEKQEEGADDLANPTHGLKIIPADAFVRASKARRTPLLPARYQASCQEYRAESNGMIAHAAMAAPGAGSASRRSLWMTCG